MIPDSKLKLKVVVDGKVIGYTTFNERNNFLSRHFVERPNNVHYYVEESESEK